MEAAQENEEEARDKAAERKGDADETETKETLTNNKQPKKTRAAGKNCRS